VATCTAIIYHNHQFDHMVCPTRDDVLQRTAIMSMYYRQCYPGAQQARWLPMGYKLATWVERSLHQG